MELEIKWTKEDIERKLREELKASGFRPIETGNVEEDDGVGKKKRQRNNTFQWAFKPQVTIRVKAEPDPDAVFEPEHEESQYAGTGAPNTAYADDDADETPIPEGSGFLPPGAATAINKAVSLSKSGKNIPRKRMVGESDERPD